MANITREEAARRKAAEAKQEVEEGGGVDLRVSENPRDPVPNVADGGPKPVTPASGTLPFDTKGTAEPLDVAQEAVDRAEAHGRVEMRTVVILRGYQPVSGPFLKEGAEVEMRIEDARFLEESGIAQSLETYKAKAK